MTEEQFEEQYKPIQNHLVKDAPFGGWMFETYDEELEFVKKQERDHIWTVIDSNDGNLFYSPGLHFVNRMGYIITEKPWVNEVDDVELEQIKE